MKGVLSVAVFGARRASKATTSSDRAVILEL